MVCVFECTVFRCGLLPVLHGGCDVRVFTVLRAAVSTAINVAVGCVNALTALTALAAIAARLCVLR
jgi:hypothetical protein